MIKKTYCIVGALIIIMLAIISPLLEMVTISGKMSSSVDLRYSIRGIDSFFNGDVSAWMPGFAFSVIFAIISLLATDVNVMEKRLETAMAIYLFSAFLYLCNAIVGVDVVWNELTDNNGVKVFTMTWIPLVLAVFTVIGYIICKAKTNNENSETKKPIKFNFNVVEKKEETTASTPTIVDSLIKYKELLDSGIITEEEYVSIKEKILND